MITKTGEAASITTHYLFFLGLYRALYLGNWLWRYHVEEFFDQIAVVSGVVQTIFYCDFFYLYFTRGQHVPLHYCYYYSSSLTDNKTFTHWTLNTPDQSEMKWIVLMDLMVLFSLQWSEEVERCLCQCQCEILEQTVRPHLHHDITARRCLPLWWCFVIVGLCLTWPDNCWTHI